MKEAVVTANGEEQKMRLATVLTRILRRHSGPASRRGVKRLFVTLGLCSHQPGCCRARGLAASQLKPPGKNCCPGPLPRARRRQSRTADNLGTAARLHC